MTLLKITFLEIIECPLNYATFVVKIYLL